MSDGDSKSAPADADPPQSAESTEKPADSEVKAATTNETPPQDQKPAESQEKPAESQEKPTENQSGDTPTAPKANADQEKAAPRGCALDFTIRVYVSSVSIDRSVRKTCAFHLRPAKYVFSKIFSYFIIVILIQCFTQSEVA